MNIRTMVCGVLALGSMNTKATPVLAAETVSGVLLLEILFVLSVCFAIRMLWWNWSVTVGWFNLTGSLSAVEPVITSRSGKE